MYKTKLNWNEVDYYYLIHIYLKITLAIQEISWLKSLTR